jgi:hypothetical protein
MARIKHGQVITLPQLENAAAEVDAINESIAAPFQIVGGPVLHNFDYLFKDLQTKPDALLPVAAKTVQDLIRLGDSMRDAPFVPGQGDSAIPAAYTYFGQFIDHDITLEAGSDQFPVKITDPNLAPVTVAQATALKNLRTATLDLDSVYGFPNPVPADPADPQKLKVGRVTTFPVRPPGKDDFNDVPRKGFSNDEETDREAEIGDARNDENLIIAQLQVAFLRAHNALVDQKKKSFDEARKLLQRHYQWLVVHDFLPRICDPKVVAAKIKFNRFYTPKDAAFFMPFEFTVAAYRFGHSMIRARYDHNMNFPTATLAQLFTFTALSGQLAPGPLPVGLGSPTLPENWIIQWERFLGKKPANVARAIDTKLVEPIFELRGLLGDILPGIQARLAVRNLLRGYLLRMPTGQAVAKKMKVKALSASDILKFAGSDGQRTVLQDSGFHKRTPLWYYILVEAAATKKGHLGVVGSTIVAEVLIGLARRSENSFFDVIGWKPTLGKKKGIFTLEDLIRLSGNL